MEILLAYDGDAAGQAAALKNIPTLLRAMPKFIVGYEFLPNVVMYCRSLSPREPALLRWKERHTMPKTHTIRKWHTELRQMPDWELELWITNAQRDICEDELAGLDVSWRRGTLNALQEERERRLSLAEKGAPTYQPGQPWQQRAKQNRVQAVKEYWVGDDFIRLFEDVTGIRPIPAGPNHWKYACPLHGDGIDKTPAGSIDPSRGLWHCFVCDSGGDVFQLLYAWPPHLTFREAVNELWSRTPH